MLCSLPGSTGSLGSTTDPLTPKIFKPPINKAVNQQDLSPCKPQKTPHQEVRNAVKISSMNTTRHARTVHSRGRERGKPWQGHLLLPRTILTLFVPRLLVGGRQSLLGSFSGLGGLSGALNDLRAVGHPVGGVLVHDLVGILADHAGTAAAEAQAVHAL